MFSQNFVLTSGQIAETAEIFQHREQFSYSDWVRSRNLGDPVGLNGFYAGWEEYCNVIHERLDYNPPEDYLLRRQDAYLQKEAEAIWVEDAKMQLFQDLTLTDMFPASVDMSTPAMVESLALMIQYDEEIVSGGVTIAPQSMIQAPTVSYTPHQGEICGFVAGTDTIAVDFGLYALLLVDLDASVKTKGSGSSSVHEYTHWVVLNIPQSSVAEGVTVVPYSGPKPARGTGLHRYVFSLYKQKKSFLQQQIDSCRAFFSKRALVGKSYDWIRSQSAVLLNVPVGVEAFLAEWDESVGVTDHTNQRSKHGSGRTRRTSDGEDSLLQSLTSTLSAEMKASAGGLDDEASRLSSSTVSSQRDFAAEESPVTPPIPAVRTGFGSILMDAEHGFFEQAHAPTRYAAANKAAVSPVNVHAADLVHAGADEEDLSRHHERKASLSVTSSDIPSRDSKEHDHLLFKPKRKHKQEPPAPSAPAPASPVRAAGPSSPQSSPDSSPEQQLRHGLETPPQQRHNPFQRKLPELRQLQDIHNSSHSRSVQEDQSPASEGPGSEDSERRRAGKPRASDEVEWLREQEAREKREKKKLLHRQREEELTRFEAARIQEERRRADAQVLEERRRISMRQEEEADRIAEEKRLKLKVDAEKLKKQEEMRRAMQEHERAEAERVRLEEAKLEEDRQRAELERVEEQRRLEQRQLEEQLRAQQRQREAEAAELERQQLLEARQLEEKRRLKQQRAEEEAQNARTMSEMQRQEEIRRQKLQQMSRMEEEGPYSPRSPQQQDYGRPPQLEERGRFMVRRQQDEDPRRNQGPPLYQQHQQPPYSPQQRSAVQQIFPYVQSPEIASPGRGSSGSPRSRGSIPSPHRHNMEEETRRFDVPLSPSTRYSMDDSGLQMSASSSPQVSPLPPPTITLPSSLSSASSDASTDGQLPGVEYESESVSSKQQRSVSFATVISSSEDSRSSSLRSARKRERAQRRLEQKMEQEQQLQQEFLARQHREAAELEMYQSRVLDQQRIQDQGSEEERQQKLRQQKEVAEMQRLRQLQEEQQQQDEQERLERARQMAVENKKRDAQYREQQRIQQQMVDEQKAQERILLQRRQDEEATLRLLQQEATERAAEQQRQLEEQQYEEQMRLLHLQLEDEHASLASHTSSRYGHEERSHASHASRPSTTHESDESVGVWGAAYDDYDEQQQILFLQHQAEAEAQEQARREQEEREHEEQLNLLHQQLLEEHLDYFNDGDEKDDREVDPEHVGFAIPDEPEEYEVPEAPYEQPRSLSSRHSTEQKQSPAHSVTSSAASTASALAFSPQRGLQIEIESTVSGSISGAASNPSRERTESESSGRSRPADSTSTRSPPSSPLGGSGKRMRGQSGDGLQQIVDGVALAQNSADLCAVFGVRTKAIFDGGTACVLSLFFITKWGS